MSKEAFPIVILVSPEDADAILWNDLHSNSQWVADVGGSYQISSAETLEEYLEGVEEA